MFVSQDRKTPNHIQTHSYTMANSVYSIHLQLDLLGLQECLLIVYLNSFFCRDQGPLMQFLSVIKHPGIANYRQMLISRYFLPKYLNSFNLITSFLRLIIDYCTTIRLLTLLFCGMTAENYFKCELLHGLVL